MKALVQRVDEASVSVGGSVVGEIDGPGLLVLVGVTHTDTVAIADAMAQKVYHLRIFDSRAYPHCRTPGSSPEVSAADLGLPVLVISQFTLYANTAKGRRPTWDAAAPADQAAPLVSAFADALRALGVVVAEGKFGADMKVHSVNDGPMTVMVQMEAKER